MDEKRKKPKEKNPNRQHSIYLVNIIVLCLVTLAALTCAMLMLMRIRTDNLRISSLNQQLASLQGENKTYYTKDQMNAEVEKAAEDASREERNDILMQIQSSLESGNSTTSMLRSLFSDDLVVVSDGKYYFFPVYSNLQKTGIRSGDFQYDGTGALVYVGDNSSIQIHKGIDVSAGNGEIDWEAVAEDGVSFAMLRVGTADEEGKTHADSEFAANLQGADDNNIETGVYFEMNAETTEEAISQAEFVVKQLSGNKDKITYPVAVIIRTVKDGSRLASLSRADWTQNLTAFCDKIQEAGYTPMIYGNLASFLMQTDVSRLEDYEKWIADFSNSVYFPYRYSMWQYSTSGSVQGIDGNVHLDLQIAGDQE